jgi:serine/threonine protein kinase
MAESLAKLHQFHGGVVVHADVNIEQWLLNNHGDLKLNDFNLAEILPWNDQTQQYCPFATRYDGGFRLVRSPEEFLGLPAGESKDVYSYGNTIYSLLTGLWPFHDELARKVDVAKRREAIYRGARPYIDERLNKTQSHIERQLLDVMYQCWHVDPNKRPTMVEVAAFLRTAKEVARAKGDLDTKSALIAI